MPANLDTFLDLYDRALATTLHLLGKAMDHAAVQGVGEAEVLGWRLAADMQPLAFQLMVVVNFSRQWPARVAGLPVPEGITAEIDAAGFVAAIADARSYLASFPPGALDARADLQLTHRINDEREFTLPCETWIAVFATTNIQFHVSIAYAILRSNGVHLSKPDMFARGL